MASKGSTGPGGGTDDPGTTCKYAWEGNPYEQVPVILDEYIKSRDVWRCPSARISHGPAWILGPPADGGPWWHRLQQDEGKWGKGTAYGLCTVPYPSGWGGSVTDSLAQDLTSGDRSDTSTPSGAFASGYASPRDLWGLSTSGMSDVSNWIVIGEYGPATKFWSDPSVRKNYTRHLGGSNLGFADGHAKWYAAEAMLAPASDCQVYTPFDDRTMSIGSPQTCGVLCCGIKKF